MSNMTFIFLGRGGKKGERTWLGSLPAPDVPRHLAGLVYKAAWPFSQEAKTLAALTPSSMEAHHWLQVVWQPERERPRLYVLNKRLSYRHLWRKFWAIYFVPWRFFYSPTNNNSYKEKTSDEPSTSTHRKTLFKHLPPLNKPVWSWYQQMSSSTNYAWLSRICQSKDLTTLFDWYKRCVQKARM